MAPVVDLAFLQAGIGLRQQHWQAMTASRPAAGFLEIHAENFLGDIGIDVLDDLRRDYPFSVHAVGMSLASATGIDEAHLNRVAGLIDRLHPALVSDHLCWSSEGGTYFNDLMPFPYTEESLAIVAANIAKVQERLKRPILIENISAYLQFRDSSMSEAEFMAALVVQTGCGILCDVNNAYVNQANHGIDAAAWLKSLPPQAGEVLIDDHGSAVIEPVWQLYDEAIKLFPQAATLVEWDTNIPALEVLVAEAAKADAIRRRSGGGFDAVAA
jgi:uncharacterized protein (UPF0276 family)